MHTQTSLVATLCLLLTAAPVLAQTDAPLEEAAQPASVGTAVDTATDEAPADLWIHQADALSRISGATGAVLEVRELAVDDCLFSWSAPVFVWPDNGSLWLRGRSSANERGSSDCFVRVPLDGSDLTVYTMLSAEGKQYSLPSEAGYAAYGDDLLVVAVSRSSSSLDDRALYRVGPGSENVELLQKAVLAVSPSRGGPIGTYLEKPNGKARYGLFDEATGKLRAPKSLSKVWAAYPPEMTPGTDGLVAGHSEFGGPAAVIDPVTASVVGEVQGPKKAALTWQAVPTSDGVWLHGVFRNNKDFTVYVTVANGKMKSIDVCAGLPEPCSGMIVGATDDAVWVHAGPYDEKRRTWVYEDATYRRYLSGETEPSLDVSAADVLQPVAYEWLE